jgi:REP element-mobilizing transposase RayT
LDEFVFMRRPRLKVPEGFPVGYYHCVSRVVDRRFIFQEPEREHVVALMRECAEFSEVRVLTHCVMSNHFHLLLAVPRRPEQLPAAEELIAKLSRLTGHQDVEGVRLQWEALRNSPEPQARDAWLERFYARLWDLSAFMKLFKQRLTQWHNGRTGRKGTLWEERFKSVLVEGEGRALAAMAAYVDLNPVRAGLVKDPKDYRWSGYGEAVAGGARAVAGVREIGRALGNGAETSDTESLELYRMHLYVNGSKSHEAVGPDGQPERGALSHAEVLRVLEAHGRLPLADYLRCKVRYFCDGVVFGSREFVEGIFRAHRAWFGPKRQEGARLVRGLAAPEFFTLRVFRLRAFG